MKKWLLGGIFMTWMLAGVPAWAQNVDTVNWLEGEYVGVGAIDMQKLAQRKIYTYLMNFFVTDKDVRVALQEVRDAGVILEDTLQRIVVGVPVDVEHSEHIVLWETSQSLVPYRELIVAHSKAFNVRNYLDVEYYATKRQNECLVILDSVLVLGSELRVKEIIASHKNGYKKGPKDAGIQSELKRVDKKKDAWFVFSISDRERTVLKRTDPLLEMPGQGALNMSEIQHGNMALDFAAGLNAKAVLAMASAESATRSSNVLNAVIKDATTDPDVVELGFSGFLPGIGFSTQKSDLKLSVVYDQAKFDDLIAMVTMFAKSVSAPVVRPETAKTAPTTATTAPAAPTAPVAPTVQ